MKRLIILALGAALLTGCARPYEPSEKVLNQEITKKKDGITQSKVTVTRNKQFIGGGSGGICKFLIQVDDKDVALLRQNQYITTYLDLGPHKLKVSNDCSTLSLGMRKTLDIVADGNDQEYVAENGVWGQYRMWRTK